MRLKKTDKEGLFKNIFIGYFILLLHVFLLAGIAIFVALIKGVFNYLPWIMAGAVILMLFIGWIIYRRMQQGSDRIKDILSTDKLRNRNVEISFLGGLAAFKIQSKKDHNLLPDHPESHIPPDSHLIETQTDRAEKKMLQLDALYEKDLISKEEFEKARQTIIQG